MGSNNSNKKSEKLPPIFSPTSTTSYSKVPTTSISLPSINSLIPSSNNLERSIYLQDSNPTFNINGLISRDNTHFQQPSAQSARSNSLIPLDDSHWRNNAPLIKKLVDYTPRTRRKTAPVEAHLNLSPDSIEKRRKNAEASSKSRVRRRIREVQLFERNHELETTADKLREENSTLHENVANLIEENSRLKLELIKCQNSNNKNNNNNNSNNNNNRDVNNSINLMSTNSIASSLLLAKNANITRLPPHELNTKESQIQYISILQERCSKLEEELKQTNFNNQRLKDHLNSISSWVEDLGRKSEK
ncbi:hypothetical protein K502DRAFT_324956 [Neoconidiobolus thromboides FSU 785]|nr:hypothetical protein K502DRAFT_324956 [Neoconidiobolus thromboides FSU 785]